MLELAYKRYKDLSCKLGAILEGGTFQPCGHGCWIQSHYILTASHVLNELRKAGAAQVGFLVRHKGVTYLCEVAWEDERADVAVLRVIREDSPPAERLKWLPPLSSNLPQIGALVGYVAHLPTRNRSTGQKDYGLACFCSMVSRKDKDVYGFSRYRLTPGYSDQGFSGTAVFAPDASLVAVLIQSDHLLFRDEKDEAAGIVVFPIVVPVSEVLHDIREAVPELVTDQP